MTPDTDTLSSPARRVRRRFALLLVALLAGAGVYAVLAPRHGVDSARETSAARQTGDPSKAVAGDPSKKGEIAVVAPVPGGAAATTRGSVAARPVRGTASPNREAFERARNLGALFNQLVRQDDPDALFFAERALRECMPYLMAGVQAGEPPPLDRYRPAPDGDPMTARRRSAYDALTARCSGFDLGADPAATRRALRDALLAVNDPRATLEQVTAEMRRGGLPEAAMDKTRALATTGDPYMLEQASAVMSAMRGKYVFMVDGQLVRPDVVAAGWMMAACDAGRSCGDEWVQSPCAFLTECDARDLESSLQRYQLTPAEYDRMQQVRNRVMRGVATGEWDPALFAPQAPPPGYRRWGP